MTQESGFLFIGGCARSGTSPLWQVVSADPSVAIGLERYARFILKPEQFTPDLFEPERFLDVREDDTFYDSFEAFPDTEYRDIGARYDDARWRGDKLPRLHPLYERIARAFPNHKILYIVRNPFDVAASFQRRALNLEDQTWQRARDLRAACSEWNASLHATRAWMGRLQIYVIDYEGFFAGQADIRGLARFLDLDADVLRAGYESQLGHPRGRKADVLGAGGRQYVSRTADFSAYRELLEAADRNRLSGWPSFRRIPRGGKKYADQDGRMLDYRYYEAVPGRWFRGPPPRRGGESSIAFLGPASTFGRFADRPYASLVAEQLDGEALNLGYGGARAPFYYTDHRLLELINRSSCAVIECFSARGTGTASIETRNHASAFLRLRGSNNEFAFADRFFGHLMETWPNTELQGLRNEIRQAYMEEMRQLFDLIEVPKVLLWLSRRPPGTQGEFTSVGDYMGKFPHFVTGPVVRALSEHVDHAVRVVSSEGIPNPLIDRNDGSPVPIFKGQRDSDRNYYYPSPEMHEAAAKALIGPVGELLGRGQVSREALSRA